MRGLATLAKLEMRRCGPLLLMPIAALALPVLAWSVQGTWRFAHAWLPDLIAVALLPLTAAGLGADALAGEREQGTWALLRARPVSLRGLVAVKAGVRLLVLAAVMLGCGAVVHAFRGAQVGWLEKLDISGAQGAVLTLLLSVTAFAGGFAAGAKLDEPLAAMIAGEIAAVALVGLLLLPGWQAGGSLRSALASPREWVAARATASDERPIRADFTSPSGRLGAAQLEDRVLLLLLDERAQGQPRRVVLPRGTTSDGTFAGELLRVSFVAGAGRVERLVDASGATRSVEVSP